MSSTQAFPIRLLFLAKPKKLGGGNFAHFSNKPPHSSCFTVVTTPSPPWANMYAATAPRHTSDPHVWGALRPRRRRRAKGSLPRHFPGTRASRSAIRGRGKSFRAKNSLPRKPLISENHLENAQIFGWIATHNPKGPRGTAWGFSQHWAVEQTGLRCYSLH